jgi:hypothetical protein
VSFFSAPIALHNNHPISLSLQLLHPPDLSNTFGTTVLLVHSIFLAFIPNLPPVKISSVLPPEQDLPTYWFFIPSWPTDDQLQNLS